MSDNEITTAQNKIVSLDVIKQSIKGKELDASKKNTQINLDSQNVIDFLNNKKTLHFGVTQGKVKEFIEQKLKINKVCEIFEEINKEPDVKNLGFELLPIVRDDVKKGCTNDFFEWAASIVKEHSYEVANDDLNTILELYIEKTDPSKILDEKHKIVELIKYNSSTNFLLAYKEFLNKAKKQYEEDTEKHLLESNTSYEKRKKECGETLRKNIDFILKSITEIIREHKERKLYTLYFDLNYKEFNDIFNFISELVKNGDIEEKDTQSEPLLFELLQYYISMADELVNQNANIGDVSKEWKLDEIFQTVAKYTNNPKLKNMILSKYDPENNFYPLPLDLISDTLFNPLTNANIGFKKTIISSFAQRYSITDASEKNIIEEINNAVIFARYKNGELISESEMPSELRKQAFDWFFDILQDETKKLNWTQSVFRQLRVDYVEDKTRFEIKDIIKQCESYIFNNIEEKHDVTVLNSFIKSPNCSADQRKELYNKIFDSLESETEKIKYAQNIIKPILCNEEDDDGVLVCIIEKTLLELIEKNPDSFSAERRDCIKYLNRSFENSDYKEKIKEIEISLISNPTQSCEFSREILRSFLEINNKNEKELFLTVILNKILNNKDISDVLKFDVIFDFLNIDTVSKNAEFLQKNCIDFIIDNKSSKIWSDYKNRFVSVCERLSSNVLLYYIEKTI